jgi:hypothetical protein
MNTLLKIAYGTSMYYEISFINCYYDNNIFYS